MLTIIQMVLLVLIAIKRIVLSVIHQQAFVRNVSQLVFTCRMENVKRVRQRQIVPYAMLPQTNVQHVKQISSQVEVDVFHAAQIIVQRVIHQQENVSHVVQIDILVEQNVFFVQMLW